MASVFCKLVEWPIVEVLLFLLWTYVTVTNWRGQPSEGPIDESFDNRQLGATVITSQLTGILTGCSIIIAGIGAFAAILGSSPPPTTAAHLRWGAVHAVIALSLAIWIMSTLPARVATKNVLRSKWVAILCAISLFFALVAGIRFVFGIWSFL